MPIETPSGPPALYTASTVGLAQREKFDYWHEVVCRNLIDLDYGLIGDGVFEATFSGIKLDVLNISRIQASAHTATRTRTGIARMGSESLVFNFVVSGGLIVEQDGRTALLGEGDGVVCDAERPYSLRFDQAFELASVQLPKRSLVHGAVSLQRVTATNFAQAGLLCPLVFGYLAGLSARAPMLDGATRAKVAHNFAELLNAMLGEVLQAAPLPLSEYRGAALLRVKDFVEQRICDFELDPAMVASALKLSPRYINQLLEAEGTSLSRYIWRRRLERAVVDLRDPGLQSRSISLIAMANGFNDLSHFSKVFRQRYGLAPRDYRSAPSACLPERQRGPETADTPGLGTEKAIALIVTAPMTTYAVTESTGGGRSNAPCVAE